TEPFTPSLGDKVTVQVQGLPVPAPVLEMVVVRKTNDGYGLQFDQNGD
ncbi:MAG: PilZ domain-containing protein, partial [Marinobacter salsuginis]